MLFKTVDIGFERLIFIFSQPVPPLYPVITGLEFCDMAAQRAGMPDKFIYEVFRILFAPGIFPPVMEIPDTGKLQDLGVSVKKALKEIRA